MEGRRVIRWTIDIDASNNTLTFNDDDGYVIAKTIAAGTYIVKGETVTGAPDDLLAAVIAAFNLAYDDFWGIPDAITGTLGPTGIVTIANAGAQIIILQTAGTTFDVGLLGFASTPINIEAGESAVSPYQAGNSWYPAADHVVDTAEHQSYAFTAQRDMTGKPHYVKHAAFSDATYKRRISWDDVQGARCVASLTALADYAAAAGLTVNDPNAPLRELIEHVIDGGQIYLYDTDDPATHTEAGPYGVVLSDDTVQAGGVSFEAERQDLLQRRYNVSLELVR